MDAERWQRQQEKRKARVNTFVVSNREDRRQNESPGQIRKRKEAERMAAFLDEQQRKEKEIVERALELADRYLDIMLFQMGLATGDKIVSVAVETEAGQLEIRPIDWEVVNAQARRRDRGD